MSGKKITSNKKFLIDVHHGLGDAVKLIPLIENIKRNQPDCQIDILISNMGIQQIFDMTKLVDGYHVVNLNIRYFRKIIKTIFELRKYRYDYGLVAPMANPVKMWLLLKVFGCRRVLIPNKKQYKDELLQSLSLVDQLGYDVQYLTPKLMVNEDTAVNVPVPRRIGICMSGKLKNVDSRYANDKRKVSDDILIEVANKLIQLGYEVILFGGPDEKNVVDLAKDTISLQIQNCVGVFNLKELIVQMSQCELVVAAECAFAHFADASGTKTLVYQTVSDMDIVGPFSNRVTRLTANLPCQYCLNSRKLNMCSAPQCVEFITAERILDEVINIIK